MKFSTIMISMLPAPGNKVLAKPLLLFIVYCALFVLCLPNMARAELVDRIVAIVNNEIITLSDLNNEGEHLFIRIKQQVPSREVDEVLHVARQELLSTLIDKLLIEQRAADLRISVSAEEVDNAFAQLLVKNNMSRQEFIDQLELIGSTEQAHRSSLKNQILQSRLISFEVRSKIVITEEKIKAYYLEHFSRKPTEINYHILQIGVTWSGERSKEEAAQQAGKLRKTIIAGNDFKKTAKSFSEMPSAKYGGDLGVFTQGEMSSHMQNMILAMQPGEISPVQEIRGGYQFFKLLSAQEEVWQPPAYEDVKGKISEILYQQALESQYQKWVTELRGQADIENLL